MSLPITDRKIFITGGAGFIGSTLIERLYEQNQIVVYDDFRRDALSGKPYADHPNITIVRGDVLDIDNLRRASKEASIFV